MQIRQLVPGDGAALVDLFGAVVPEFLERLVDPAAPESFLGDPASFVFGAWLDTEPAGLAWGVQVSAPTGRRFTYLHELDVRERFRRRGIGTRLVLDSMTWAREHGSTRFWLSTGGHNGAAQALYESLGGDRKPLGDVNYWWQLDPPT